MTNSGFTLVELLVVIAVIGILSTIVINQLNSARLKGADAAAKASFKNIGTASVQYYDVYENYSGFCSHTGNAAVPSKINQMWLSVGATCSNAASNYRVKVLLRTPNSYSASSGSDDFLCLDSTANIKIQDSDPGGGSGFCP